MNQTLMMSASIPPLPTAETLNTLGALLTVISDPKKAKENFEVLKKTVEEIRAGEKRIEEMNEEAAKQVKKDRTELAKLQAEADIHVRDMHRRAEQLDKRERELNARLASVKELEDRSNNDAQTLRQRQQVLEQRELDLSMKMQEAGKKIARAEQRIAEVEKREEKLNAVLAAIK